MSDESESSLGDTIRAIWDRLQGKNPALRKPKKVAQATTNPKPAHVPMGSGMAEGARKAVAGRGRQIDEAVENAQK